MDTINIVCRLNENDNFTISNKAHYVNLTNKEKCHYTFWSNKNILKTPQFFSDEALDLFYISLFVYYADRIIPRNSFPDAWTRNIGLHIPVLSVHLWNRLKNDLEKMLSFLSGDIWHIDFRGRELNNIETVRKEKFEKQKCSSSFLPDSTPNTICMLSGGLDSFIGAVDFLQKTQDISFVGHYGGGRGVSQFQALVNDALIKKYSLSQEQFFNFYVAPLNGHEDTTRTRSFMFFAHGIVLASALGREIRLLIPENGLISLNIPLTASRLGSSSTRTTHPYYMKILQSILDNLNMAITLENPYQFKTKGEMISECKDIQFLKDNIKNTMSCSHPDHGRYQGESEPSHCGTCLPCIIRRSAIKKANINDSSIYRDPNFIHGETAKNDLKAYKIGVTKHQERHLRGFLQIQMAGPISEKHKEFVKLYNRGMQEIIDFLDEY